MLSQVSSGADGTIVVYDVVCSTGDSKLICPYCEDCLEKNCDGFTHYGQRKDRNCYVRPLQSDSGCVKSKSPISTV